MSNILNQINVPEGFIRLSGPIEIDNIENGPGLRTILWTQGCRQHCFGCQNPQTWDENSGILVSIDSVIDKLKEHPEQQGITFCGGEPLIQAKALTKITQFCKQELNWDVWSFTGLIYEKCMKDPTIYSLIKELDGLIDGPFILSKRDIVNYKWRGSSNQRVLHLTNGNIIKIE